MTYRFGTTASRQVISTLTEAGYEAVFVGGAVRDYLRGKQPHDFDVATSAEPSEVQALFPTTFEVGIAHGTVLVRQDGESVEVTTYRTEGTYSDHRRPDSVQFVKSLKEDLQRRDFTVNALAMTKDGQLIDYYGGQEDLHKGLIRAVGNAVERFTEDALRIVRAIRFVSTLQFTIETQTLRAIESEREQIHHIAIERIKNEFDKLFQGHNSFAALQLIEKTNVSTVLPLFPSSVEPMASVVPFSSAIEGWAALMLAGEYTASDIARAYKLSNEEKQQLSAIHALFQKRMDNFYTVRELYMYSLEVLQIVEKLFANWNSQCPTMVAQEIADAKSALPIQSLQDIAVTGKELIAWTDDKGGPWTGVWLRKIEEAILLKECENDSNKIKEWFLHAYKRER